MARFHVRDTFATKDNRTFVLAGFVVEGEVEAGMTLRLPLQDYALVTAEIERLEAVHRPDGDVVCLCLHCDGPSDVSLWQALALKDRAVEVVTRP
jgi:hypothetical protein